MPGPEFCICGIVGRHLTRADLYVRQRSGATFTKVSIYLAMTLACSGRIDEEPSAKDSISEFVQPLELLVNCIARRDLNSRLTPTARPGDASSSMELLHRNYSVCRPGRGLQ